ncbi:MAG: butyrate kinase [Syntrophaceae bacterium]|nr:butyrate kinase [Syntrophaceae bacterium]
MDKEFLLLAINVGSTSTKVAFFRGEQAVAQENIVYRGEDLSRFSSLAEQLPLREEGVLKFLEKNGIGLEEIDIVVSRGGLGRPAPAGAYRIDDAMRRDLLEGVYGTHPSALGPSMALDFSKKCGMPAIVIDPPSTDEFEPLARISGIPEIERKSGLHALNQKMAARRCAAGLGKKYEEIDVVVAHLGGGITIGAHRKGRVVDCTHGLAEGPFTPERAGALPTMDLLDLALSGTMDRKQLQGRLVGKGGLAAYLGTTDARVVEERIRGGDEKAGLVFEAMAYQAAKDIGAMSTVLAGRIDGIVLTGGLAHSEMLTGRIGERVRFIAPVFVYPGEDEMTALAEGGLRVLRNEEDVKPYS